MSYQLPEALVSLVPYEPLAGDYSIRLDANESFLQLPDTLRDEISDAVKSLDFNRYPDPNCTQLCRAFAGFYGVDAALTVAGNGSDELIGLIVSSFVDAQHTMVTVHPDFSMYRFYAQLAGVKTDIFEKASDSLALDADALIEFCRVRDARLLLFSNPCNPTSLLVSRQIVVRLAEALPQCLVVADEAYMDFADGSVMSEVEKHDNLIVLKTCSKALGAAAIRLGFAVCPPAIAQALRAVKSPYNVNTMTQAAGCVLFSHPDYLYSCIEQIKASRTQLYALLDALAQKSSQILQLYNTQANFVFVRMQDAKRVCELVGAQGIALRLMGDFIRITAGSEAENRQIASVLERICSK